MPLETTDTRTVIAVQAIADHWGITAFTVQTPQDGGLNRLVISSESWVGEPGANRTGVTPHASTEYIDNAEIHPLLERTGQVYETMVAHGETRANALYIGLRTALQEARQAEGIFPSDAHDELESVIQPVMYREMEVGAVALTGQTPKTHHTITSATIEIPVGAVSVEGKAGSI